MKDLMEMAYEIDQSSKNNIENHYTFIDMFFEELRKMKSTDIAPYFSCVYELPFRHYKVTLTLPESLFDKPDADKSDVK